MTCIKKFIRFQSLLLPDMTGHQEAGKKRRWEISQLLKMSFILALKLHCLSLRKTICQEVQESQRGCY